MIIGAGSIGSSAIVSGSSIFGDKELIGIGIPNNAKTTCLIYKKFIVENVDLHAQRTKIQTKTDHSIIAKKSKTKGRLTRIITDVDAHITVAPAKIKADGYVTRFIEKLNPVQEANTEGIVYQIFLGEGSLISRMASCNSVPRGPPLTASGASTQGLFSRVSNSVKCDLISDEASTYPSSLLTALVMKYVDIIVNENAVFSERDIDVIRHLYMNIKLDDTIIEADALRIIGIHADIISQQSHINNPLPQPLVSDESRTTGDAYHISISNNDNLKANAAHSPMGEMYLYRFIDEELKANSAVTEGILDRVVIIDEELYSNQALVFSDIPSSHLISEKSYTIGLFSRGLNIYENIYAGYAEFDKNPRNFQIIRKVIGDIQCEKATTNSILIRQANILGDIISQNAFTKSYPPNSHIISEDAGTQGRIVRTSIATGDLISENATTSGIFSRGLNVSDSLFANSSNTQISELIRISNVLGKIFTDLANVYSRPPNNNIQSDESDTDGLVYKIEYVSGINSSDSAITEGILETDKGVFGDIRSDSAIINDILIRTSNTFGNIKTTFADIYSYPPSNICKSNNASTDGLIYRTHYIYGEIICDYIEGIESDIDQRIEIDFHVTTVDHATFDSLLIRTSYIYADIISSDTTIGFNLSNHLISDISTLSGNAYHISHIIGDIICEDHTIECDAIRGYNIDQDLPASYSLVDGVGIRASNIIGNIYSNPAIMGTGLNHGVHRYDHSGEATTSGLLHHIHYVYGEIIQSESDTTGLGGLIIRIFDIIGDIQVQPAFIKNQLKTNIKSSSATTDSLLIRTSHLTGDLISDPIDLDCIIHKVITGYGDLSKCGLRTFYYGIDLDSIIQDTPERPWTLYYENGQITGHSYQGLDEYEYSQISFYVSDKYDLHVLAKIASPGHNLEYVKIFVNDEQIDYTNSSQEGDEFNNLTFDLGETSHELIKVSIRYQRFKNSKIDQLFIKNLNSYEKKRACAVVHGRLYDLKVAQGELLSDTAHTIGLLEHEAREYPIISDSASISGYLANFKFVNGINVPFRRELPDAIQITPETPWTVYTWNNTLSATSYKPKSSISTKSEIEFIIPSEITRELILEFMWDIQNDPNTSDAFRILFDDEIVFDSYNTAVTKKPIFIKLPTHVTSVILGHYRSSINSRSVSSVKAFKISSDHLYVAKLHGTGKRIPNVIGDIKTNYAELGAGIPPSKIGELGLGEATTSGLIYRIFIEERDLSIISNITDINSDDVFAGKMAFGDIITNKSSHVQAELQNGSNIIGNIYSDPAYTLSLPVNSRMAALPVSLNDSIVYKHFTGFGNLFTGGIYQITRLLRYNDLIQDTPDYPWTVNVWDTPLTAYSFAGLPRDTYSQVSFKTKEYAKVYISWNVKSPSQIFDYFTILIDNIPIFSSNSFLSKGYNVFEYELDNSVPAIVSLRYTRYETSDIDQVFINNIQVTQLEYTNAYLMGMGSTGPNIDSNLITKGEAKTYGIANVYTYVLGDIKVKDANVYSNVPNNTAKSLPSLINSDVITAKNITGFNVPVTKTLYNAHQVTPATPWKISENNGDIVASSYAGTSANSTLRIIIGNRTNIHELYLNISLKWDIKNSNSTDQFIIKHNNETIFTSSTITKKHGSINLIVPHLDNSRILFVNQRGNATNNSIVSIRDVKIESFYKPRALFNGYGDLIYNIIGDITASYAQMVSLPSDSSIRDPHSQTATTTGLVYRVHYGQGNIEVTNPSTTELGYSFVGMTFDGELHSNHAESNGLIFKGGFIIGNIYSNNSKTASKPADSKLIATGVSLNDAEIYRLVLGYGDLIPRGEYRYQKILSFYDIIQDTPEYPWTILNKEIPIVTRSFSNIPKNTYSQISFNVEEYSSLSFEWLVKSPYFNFEYFSVLFDGVEILSSNSHLSSPNEYTLSNFELDNENPGVVSLRYTRQEKSNIDQVFVKNITISQTQPVQTIINGILLRGPVIDSELVQHGLAIINGDVRVHRNVIGDIQAEVASTNHIGPISNARSLPVTMDALLHSMKMASGITLPITNNIDDLIQVTPLTPWTISQGTNKTITSYNGNGTHSEVRIDLLNRTNIHNLYVRISLFWDSFFTKPNNKFIITNDVDVLFDSSVHTHNIGYIDLIIPYKPNTSISFINHREYSTDKTITSIRDLTVTSYYESETIVHGTGARHTNILGDIIAAPASTLSNVPASKMQVLPASTNGLVHYIHQATGNIISENGSIDADKIYVGLFIEADFYSNIAKTSGLFSKGPLIDSNVNAKYASTKSIPYTSILQSSLASTLGTQIYRLVEGHGHVITRGLHEHERLITWYDIEQDTPIYPWNIESKIPYFSGNSYSGLPKNTYSQISFNVPEYTTLHLEWVLLSPVHNFNYFTIYVNGNEQFQTNSFVSGNGKNITKHKINNTTPVKISLRYTRYEKTYIDKVFIKNIKIINEHLDKNAVVTGFASRGCLIDSHLYNNNYAQVSGSGDVWFNIIGNITSKPASTRTSGPDSYMQSQSAATDGLFDSIKMVTGIGYPLIRTIDNIIQVTPIFPWKVETIGDNTIASSYDGFSTHSEVQLLIRKSFNRHRLTLRWDIQDPEPGSHFIIKQNGVEIFNTQQEPTNNGYISILFYNVRITRLAFIFKKSNPFSKSIVSIGKFNVYSLNDRMATVYGVGYRTSILDSHLYSSKTYTTGLLDEITMLTGELTAFNATVNSNNGHNSISAGDTTLYGLLRRTVHGQGDLNACGDFNIYDYLTVNTIYNAHSYKWRESTLPWPGVPSIYENKPILTSSKSLNTNTHSQMTVRGRNGHDVQFYTEVNSPSTLSDYFNIYKIEQEWLPIDHTLISFDEFSYNAANKSYETTSSLHSEFELTHTGSIRFELSYRNRASASWMVDPDDYIECEITVDDSVIHFSNSIKTGYTSRIINYIPKNVNAAYNIKLVINKTNSNLHAIIDNIMKPYSPIYDDNFDFDSRSHKRYITNSILLEHNQWKVIDQTSYDGELTNNYTTTLASGETIRFDYTWSSSSGTPLIFRAGTVTLYTTTSNVTTYTTYTYRNDNPTNITFGINKGSWANTLSVINRRIYTEEIQTLPALMNIPTTDEDTLTFRYRRFTSSSSHNHARLRGLRYRKIKYCCTEMEEYPRHFVTSPTLKVGSPTIYNDPNAKQFDIIGITGNIFNKTLHDASLTRSTHSTCRWVRTTTHGHTIATSPLNFCANSSMSYHFDKLTRPYDFIMSFSFDINTTDMVNNRLLIRHNSDLLFDSYYAQFSLSIAQNDNIIYRNESTAKIRIKNVTHSSAITITHWKSTPSNVSNSTVYNLNLHQQTLPFAQINGSISLLRYYNINIPIKNNATVYAEVIINGEIGVYANIKSNNAERIWNHSEINNDQTIYLHDFIDDFVPKLYYGNGYLTQASANYWRFRLATASVPHGLTHYYIFKHVYNEVNRIVPGVAHCNYLEHHIRTSYEQGNTRYWLLYANLDNILADGPDYDTLITYIKAVHAYSNDLHNLLEMDQAFRRHSFHGHRYLSHYLNKFKTQGYHLQVRSEHNVQFIIYTILKYLEQLLGEAKHRSLSLLGPLTVNNSLIQSFGVTNDTQKGYFNIPALSSNIYAETVLNQELLISNNPFSNAKPATIDAQVVMTLYIDDDLYASSPYFVAWTIINDELTFNANLFSGLDVHVKHPIKLHDGIQETPSCPWYYDISEDAIANCKSMTQNQTSSILFEFEDIIDFEFEWKIISPLFDLEYFIIFVNNRKVFSASSNDYNQVYSKFFYRSRHNKDTLRLVYNKKLNSRTDQVFIRNLKTTNREHISTIVSGAAHKIFVNQNENINAHASIIEASIHRTVFLDGDIKTGAVLINYNNENNIISDSAHIDIEFELSRTLTGIHTFHQLRTHSYDLYYDECDWSYTKNNNVIVLTSSNNNSCRISTMGIILVNSDNKRILHFELDGTYSDVGDRFVLESDIEVLLDIPLEHVYRSYYYIDIGKAKWLELLHIKTSIPSIGRSSVRDLKIKSIENEAHTYGYVQVYNSTLFGDIHADSAMTSNIFDNTVKGSNASITSGLLYKHIDSYGIYYQRKYGHPIKYLDEFTHSGWHFTTKSHRYIKLHEIINNTSDHWNIYYDNNGHLRVDLNNYINRENARFSILVGDSNKNLIDIDFEYNKRKTPTDNIISQISVLRNGWVNFDIDQKTTTNNEYSFRDYQLIDKPELQINNPTWVSFYYHNSQLGNTPYNTYYSIKNIKITETTCHEQWNNDIKDYDELISNKFLRTGGLFTQTTNIIEHAWIDASHIPSGSKLELELKLYISKPEDYFEIISFGGGLQQIFSTRDSKYEHLWSNNNEYQHVYLETQINDGTSYIEIKAYTTLGSNSEFGVRNIKVVPPLANTNYAYIIVESVVNDVVGSICQLYTHPTNIECDIEITEREPITFVIDVDIVSSSSNIDVTAIHNNMILLEDELSSNHAVITLHDYVHIKNVALDGIAQFRKVFMPSRRFELSKVNYITPTNSDTKWNITERWSSQITDFIVHATADRNRINSSGGIQNRKFSLYVPYSGKRRITLEYDYSLQYTTPRNTTGSSPKPVFSSIDIIVKTNNILPIQNETLEGNYTIRKRSDILDSDNATHTGTNKLFIRDTKQIVASHDVVIDFVYQSHHSTLAHGYPEIKDIKIYQEDHRTGAKIDSNFRFVQNVNLNINVPNANIHFDVERFYEINADLYASHVYLVTMETNEDLYARRASTNALLYKSHQINNEIIVPNYYYNVVFEPTVYDLLDECGHYEDSTIYDTHDVYKDNNTIYVVSEYLNDNNNKILCIPLIYNHTEVVLQLEYSFDNSELSHGFVVIREPNDYNDIEFFKLTSLDYTHEYGQSPEFGQISVTFNTNDYQYILLDTSLEQQVYYKNIKLTYKLEKSSTNVYGISVAERHIDSELTIDKVSLNDSLIHHIHYGNGSIVSNPVTTPTDNMVFDLYSLPSVVEFDINKNANIIGNIISSNSYVIGYDFITIKNSFRQESIKPAKTHGLLYKETIIDAQLYSYQTQVQSTTDNALISQQSITLGNLHKILYIGKLPSLTRSHVIADIKRGMHLIGNINNGSATVGSTTSVNGVSVSHPPLYVFNKDPIKLYQQPATVDGYITDLVILTGKLTVGTSKHGTVYITDFKQHTNMMPWEIFEINNELCVTTNRSMPQSYQSKVSFEIPEWCILDFEWDVITPYEDPDYFRVYIDNELVLEANSNTTENGFKHFMYQNNTFSGKTILFEYTTGSNIRVNRAITKNIKYTHITPTLINGNIIKEE